MVTKVIDLDVIWKDFISLICMLLLNLEVSIFNISKAKVKVFPALSRQDKNKMHPNYTPVA